MSLLSIHVSLAGVSGEDAGRETLTGHAEAAGGHGGPSHHVLAWPPGVSAHDHNRANDGVDVWLAQEFSPWFDGDWLDSDTGESSGGDDALPWCGASLPQSSTSVDCSSTPSALSPSRLIPDAMTKCLDVFGLLDRPAGDHQTRDDADAANIQSGPPRMALSPARSIKREDEDVKVEMDHEQRVAGDENEELRRRRQRAYERKYRQKKQGRAKRVFEEWAAKEIELHLLLQQHARPFRVDQPRASFAQLVREQRAALADEFALKALATWHKVFELRNHTESRVLHSRQAWARIDRALLGPCVIKPFRPFHHKSFEW